MTTIAYHNGVLAADRRQCISTTIMGEVTKIVCAPTGELAAAAGSAGYNGAFKRWVTGGMKGDAPEAKEDASYMDRGFLVHLDRTLEVFEPQGRFLVEADAYALGSGREHALTSHLNGGSSRIRPPRGGLSCVPIRTTNGVYL